MARRIIVGSFGALVALVLYAAGIPWILASVAGVGIFVLADRLGLIPPPFEPSMRDLLESDEKVGPDGKRPEGN